MTDDCKCNEDGYCVEHAEMLRIGRGEPALSADEKIAQDAYGECMRDDSDDARVDFVRIVSQAIATARVEGYRAGFDDAKEAAAKVAERVGASVGMRRTPEGQQAISFCDEIAEDIRALAPADKEKP